MSVTYSVHMIELRRMKEVQKALFQFLYISCTSEYDGPVVIVSDMIKSYSEAVNQFPKDHPIYIHLVACRRSTSICVCDPDNTRLIGFTENSDCTSCYTIHNLDVIRAV
jgi:hypothetical protein